MQTSFYCESCEYDFEAPAKNTCNGKTKIAECPQCSKVAKRFRFNKKKDRFYYVSRDMKKARIQYARDLIQWDDESFEFYHGDRELAKKKMAS